MTCVVGLEHRGHVWIGGDSAGVSGWALTARADEKVFRNGPCVMGFTSSFRMGQLLRYSLTIPPQHEGVGDEEYMVTAFVDAVRECLKAGGYAKKENEVEAAGQFLVGHRGTLWKVDSDYQVGRSLCGYAAVGCGDEFALGALHATAGDAPKRRINRALYAAADHSAGVRPPFTVIRTT